MWGRFERKVHDTGKPVFQGASKSWQLSFGIDWALHTRRKWRPPIWVRIIGIYVQLAPLFLVFELDSKLIRAALHLVQFQTFVKFFSHHFSCWHWRINSHSSIPSSLPRKIPLVLKLNLWRGLPSVCHEIYKYAAPSFDHSPHGI